MMPCARRRPLRFRNDLAALGGVDAAWRLAQLRLALTAALLPGRGEAAPRARSALSATEQKRSHPVRRASFAPSARASRRLLVGAESDPSVSTPRRRLRHVVAPGFMPKDKCAASSPGGILASTGAAGVSSTRATTSAASVAKQSLAWAWATRRMRSREPADSQTRSSP